MGRRLLSVLSAYARALPDAERDLLARLSLFPSGATIDVLLAIAAAGGIVGGELPADGRLAAREPAQGARACRLGRRVYRDRLELQEEEPGGRRRYRIYGEDPDYQREEGTDFAAIAEGFIAVTPLHFDLTDVGGIESLAGFDLDGLLRPAAREVE